MRNENLGTLQALFPIITNLAILPGMIKAYRRHLYVAWVVQMNVLVWSTLYHTCDGFSYLCPGRFALLSLMDHFFAVYLFISFVVLATVIENPFHEALAYAVSANLVGVAIVFEGYGTLILVALVAVAVLLMLLKWYRKGVPDFDWLDFSVALCLGAAGLVLFFIFDAEDDDYWFYHGLWHALSMPAACFVIEGLDKRQALLGLIVRRGHPDYVADSAYLAPHASPPPSSVVVSIPHASSVQTQLGSISPAHNHRHSTSSSSYPTPAEGGFLDIAPPLASASSGGGSVVVGGGSGGGGGRIVFTKRNRV